MINGIKNGPSFGWHYPTHEKIVALALDGVKIPSDEAGKILKRAVQKPDFDEVLLQGQNHFFYPKGLMKSYLDVTGKCNAKAAYHKHILKMYELLARKEEAYALDEAGRALHYLQDITQPNHIQPGSALTKLFDKKMHRDFEMKAFLTQDKLLDNANQYPFFSSGFGKLFKDTVNASSLNKYPSKNNANEWENIAQRGVDTAVGATKRFLEILSARLQ